MNHPLFDHEIDANPWIRRSPNRENSVTPKPGVKIFSPSMERPASGPNPNFFSTWFEGLDLLNLIGFGMVMGALISGLLVLALPSLVEKPQRASALTPRRIESLPAASPAPLVAVQDDPVTEIPQVEIPELKLAPASVADEARVELPPAHVPTPREILADVPAPREILRKSLRPTRRPLQHAQPDDRIPRATVGLAAIMDGVRWTTSSAQWQQTALPNPKLIRAIEVVIGEIRLATGDPTVGLPVRFGDVPPGLDTNPERVIYVASSPRFFGQAGGIQPVVLDAGRANRAILIVDGDIVLTAADDCLILATGEVRISYPTRCVIFAGRSIQASHDTESLLVAGSKVVVSHSNSVRRPPMRLAIYSAPDLVQVSHAADVIFLNAVHRKVSHQTGCRPLDWPGLDFSDSIRDGATPQRPARPQN